MEEWIGVTSRPEIFETKDVLVRICFKGLEYEALTRI